MAKTDLKTASVLAFERKLDPSDALFSGGKWGGRDNGEKWAAVTVRERTVRGTTSHRKAGQGVGVAKLSGEIESPNPQTGDIATLPNDADTLRVRFTLRILGGAGTPSACNNADYQIKLQGMVQQYAKDIGFAELARRYASNLANGRFLWRNRMRSEQIEVQVRQLAQGEAAQSWSFDALSFSLRDFAADSPALGELAKVIEQGLSGQAHALLEIVAYARVGDGQEVFPSQELISGGQEKLLADGKTKVTKNKTLYKVGDVAGFHSQKIGNALRTIDTWYPADEENGNIGPIAVEPYGSVTSQGKAYRQPKQKADFYNLLDEWVLKDKSPEAGNQHFVMATLIRGGVFGAKD